MKILRLDLLAFGHFSDLQLDLSAGEHGVQLIYGPNEAGKSTALRALRALFYGVETRSDDGFLHGNDKVRVGAIVRHSDGTTMDFVRRRGRLNTYLDRAGNAADETPLRRWLSAVDEQLFTSLFGIDHARLIAGGEGILRGGGDVGESLFAAGLGGGSLRAALQKLDEEAAELFKPQGQNQSINRACKEFAEARKEVTKHALPTREFEERQAALAKAQEESAQFAAELQKLRSESSRLERLGRALPLIAPRAALLEELQAAGNVPALSPGFTQQRVAVVAELAAAAERKERETARTANLQRELSALEIPEPLLAQAATISDLHLRLGAQRKAAHDLSALRTQLADVERDAERLGRELREEVPLAGASLPSLTRSQRQKVQALATRRPALAQAAESAALVARKLGAELKLSRERMEKLGEPVDAASLKRAVTAAQKEGDLEAELARAESSLSAASDAAERLWRKLKPRAESLLATEALVVPSAETVARYEQEFEAASQSRRVLEDRASELREEAARTRAALEELLLGGAVPSEEELAAARARRDEQWAGLRQQWPAAADAAFTSYERRVAEADDVADTLRRDAERVARRAQLELKLSQHGAAELSLAGEIDKCASVLAELRTAWAAEWQPLHPLPPREMAAWRREHAHLLEHAETVRECTARRDAIYARIQSHRDSLTARLAELALEAREGRLTDLLDQCQAHVAALDRAAAQRETLLSEVAKLTARAEAARIEQEQAESALVRWGGEWWAAMQAVGWSENVAAEDANALIASNADWHAALADAEKLRERIGAMDKEAADFAADAKQLCRAIAPELAERAPAEAIAQLQTRVAKAKEDDARRAELLRQMREAAQQFDEATAAIAHAQARLAEMCRLAGCERAEELEPIEVKSREVQERRARLAALEEQLAKESAGVSLEDFVRELGGLDADAIAAEIALKREGIERLELMREQANRTAGAEHLQVISMDGNAQAAEAAERAEAILAQIEEQSERYLRLRLAAAILRLEIERYRTENQDPLLRRAAEFFRELTLGSFTSITTDFDSSDHPVLKGVRPSGDDIGVQGMSEGTRDQLFLALQLASVEKFIAASEAMPFIVDDVLIAFDQQREAAVLRVLAELSRKTQVILFTHHAHLVDLAKRTLTPDVLRVHELPRRTV